MAPGDRCNASLVIERGIEASAPEQARLCERRRSRSATNSCARRQTAWAGCCAASECSASSASCSCSTTRPRSRSRSSGAMRIGAVPVPVSVRESAENFRHFLEDSRRRGGGLRRRRCSRRCRRRCRATSCASSRAAQRRAATELDAALAAQEDELDVAATRRRRRWRSGCTPRARPASRRASSTHTRTWR